MSAFLGCGLEANREERIGWCSGGSDFDRYIIAMASWMN